MFYQPGLLLWAYKEGNPLSVLDYVLGLYFGPYFPGQGTLLGMTFLVLSGLLTLGIMRATTR